MLENEIGSDIEQAVQSLQHSGAWPVFELGEILVEMSDDDSHGDYASNVALQLTKDVQKAPMDIAQEIVSALKGRYDSVDVARPGFLNFTVSNEALGDAAKELLAKGDKFGRSNVGKRQKVMLEFISANPTGPLTLPNGRGGFLGDVLANVLTELNYQVTREYYLNDRGNQIAVLGESVTRRYLQQQGINVDYSEELYQGDYIDELAKGLDLKDYKLNSPGKMEWVRERVSTIALDMMVKEIRRVVEEKMGIQYDNWFSEKSLYESGLIEKVMEILKEKGYLYEKEDALWVKTSEFGDDKDRVAVKTGGEGTYLQGDIALFYDRAFDRHFKKVIMILGADHHGYEGRMMAIPHMLESKTGFDLIFIQMATLFKDGEEVRMSKRKGNFVTIEELIDEVGHDVARFFFLMYSSDKHMKFDLGLAKERSENNPVYYVQYAHARLSSVLREVEKIATPTKKTIELTNVAERDLVKALLRLPLVLQQVGENYEAHHLTTYAQEIARMFHHFYAHCRVIDNGEVNESRYWLLQATKLVLAKTLSVIGVDAPEKM